MAQRKQPRSPFDIPITQAQRDTFTNWLIDELQNACTARSMYIGDGGYIDVWHGLYEQAERPRNEKKWDDAADLSSWIPTEKVDSMRARLVGVVFGVNPICVADGWGASASQEAKVESFHQWKARDEKLKRIVSKTIHKSLIEGTGVLEVTERSVLRKTRSTIQAKVVTDAFGAMTLDEEGNPIADRDAAGGFQEETDANRPAVQTEVEYIEDVNAGPQYRVLSLKDFLFLPGHARDESDLWGYAKRVYVRLPTLQQRAQSGIYDAESVGKMGTDGEREHRAEHTRQGIEIASQVGPTAEKELWEVHLLHDIDDDGIEEWIVATISLKHSVLLRVVFDDLKQVRYVPFTPYPNDDSVYGFSYVGHKLWTVTEEHTALRNMKADRTAMATSAPLKRLSTAYWDPDEEPIGPGMTITVRDMGEVQQMQIADVPNSVIESERAIEQAAERLSGQSDTAMSGVRPESRRTATEISTVAQASYVRVEEIVHWIQEGVEDLYALRHVLYRRMLEKQANGIAPPKNVLKGLESRGVEIPKEGAFKFTAEDLAGTWTFEARGSVETADPQRMRGDFAESLQALSAIGQTFPQVPQLMAETDAFITVLEQWARLYRMPELEMKLKEEIRKRTQQAEQGMPLPGAAAMPPAAGLPPGLPPWMADAVSGMLPPSAAPEGVG